MSEQKDKIFVVEDEILIASEMSGALEDLGFEVVGPCVHLREAAERARCEEIDAAFLDVHLGGSEDTEEVAQILRQRDVPFVFITAYDREEITFVLPDERVIRKPVYGGKLHETLRSVLPDLTRDQGLSA